MLPRADQHKILTITDLTKSLKENIEGNFSNVWLKGEISNFKIYQSGHYYFTLKDAHAQISAVMFKGYQRLLKFDVKEGLSVIAHGRLSIYEARGQYQILVDQLEPEGVGALRLAFEQLKEKLSREGLFDPARKRALPSVPQKIGLVTSIDGAVVHDMVNILRRRFPNIHLIIYPVRVQGDGAAQEIVSAIGYFSKNKSVDLVIVGRGGGSLEDLWAFNEEIVARAVAACSVPVVSAVGHETDFTICDFVADVRAPTPSAAAELCVPVKEDLVARIDEQKARLISLMQNRIKHLKLKVLLQFRSIPTPDRVIQTLWIKCDDLVTRLQNCFEQRVSDLKHRVKEYAIKLMLLNPKNVLERGFAMAQDTKGNVLTRKKQAEKQDRFDVVFYDGNLRVKSNGQ